MKSNPWTRSDINEAIKLTERFGVQPVVCPFMKVLIGNTSVAETLEDQRTSRYIEYARLKQNMIVKGVKRERWPCNDMQPFDLNALAINDLFCNGEALLHPYLFHFWLSDKEDERPIRKNKT